MINVMVCDPDSFSREGIKQILEAHADLKVVSESMDVAGMFHGLRESAPDICIMELSVAGHSGLCVIRDVKRRAPSVPLLVMSHCHERDVALRTIRAGAAGYLSKDCNLEQLNYAVRTAASHRPYVSDTVCEMIVESLVEGRSKRQHDSLSDTDFEVFRLTAEGIPAAKVAAACKLSVATVRASKNRILKKLSLHSEAEMIEYAVRRKLINRSWQFF